MTEAGKVICSLDALADFADKMASASGKHWRKMAKTAAEARDTIDQLLRDLDAMERVRDGRAGKIIRRGVVMLNIDWWRRLLEAEEKNLSAAVAASPLSGETRGEAARWISVKDRLPEEGVQVLVWEKHGSAYAAYVNKQVSGVWQIGDTNGAIITHWIPLPEGPEEGDTGE